MCITGYRIVLYAKECILLAGGAGESWDHAGYQSHDSLPTASISMQEWGGVTFLISRMIMIYIFGWSFGHFLGISDRSVLCIYNLNTTQTRL